MIMKDKILFWFGADFTHFCLSYYLQKMYDCDIFAIMDITDRTKKFFLEQDLIKFQKEWFFHDYITIHKKPDLEYLASFEKKYDIDLWKLAINERILYRFYDFHKFTNDEILSILESECKLFESILDEIKPDFFITKEPAFHHLELFYELCRKKGVKILMLSQPNIGYRCIISEEHITLDSFDDLSSIKTSNKSFVELQKYLDSQILSKQIKTYNQKKSNIKNWISALIEYLFLSNNKTIRTNYNYYGRTKFRVISYMLSSILKKKYRRYFIDRKLVKNPNLAEKFVYFPLAVDLERNLLIDAPLFTNQVEIVRSVAKSIPIGYKLYVKENPSQVTREWRKISEYLEIMAIPNLTLIHPSFSGQQLLQNCSLVVTIAGSSGFEAAFYGKPSLVFANVGYKILPSVKRVREIDLLPRILKISLEEKVNPDDLEKYLILIENNSFNFDWFDFSSKIHNKFYYNGLLHDAKISTKTMSEFLKEEEETLTLLSTEHIKKIQKIKNQLVI